MRYFTEAQLRKQLGAEYTTARAASFLGTTADAGVLRYLQHLRQADTVLFVGWIENDLGLSELLQSGNTSIHFRDELKLLNHTLANAFRHFISPLLYPHFLKAARSENFGAVMSYLPLLDADTRPVVEDQIYKEIDPLFEDVRSAFDQKIGEQALIALTQKAVNDAIIDTINHFSRASYALKLKYVDATLEIVNARSCTLRFANWLLKQLEKLQLNPEHQYKINDLRVDLKNGHINVRNTNTRRGSVVPFRSILYTTLILAIIGFGTWVVMYRPWSEPEKPQISENSSFTSFSKEERKQLDSLLRILQPVREIEQDPYDLGTFLGEEIDITLRQPFKNAIAEQYYQDLNSVVLHIDAFKGDSCISLSQSEAAKSKPIPMLPLLEKTDGKETYIKNESTYAVQVIVFRNMKHSEVFYAYLPEGEKMTLKLEIGDVLWIVPGNALRHFEIPDGYNGPLPSADFNQFFCDIDMNHVSGMNAAYVVTSNAKSNYKFLLVGTATERFELVDLYGVLTQY